jgi:hypothetical protein
MFNKKAPVYYGCFFIEHWELNILPHFIIQHLRRDGGVHCLAAVPYQGESWILYSN